MAQFGIKAPFKAANIEAQIQKSTVQIGKMTAAFGVKEDMLGAFGFDYATEEQAKVAQAV